MAHPLALRSAALPPQLMDRAAVPHDLPAPECAIHLSHREEEIARLTVQGFSNKEIGQRLRISHWTVATHLRRIFTKLEITRRIELCAVVLAADGRTGSRD
ncbi:LuxR C-terminal-related transcriptional regulator [Sphingomonas sp. BK580]|uniref:response regulator transcription factor n=1 Tax=Sphingomonas sp. BK580 TaxID=2586972 RepID=UPI0016093137